MDKITSLVEARKQFATQEACETYLTQTRWPDGVTCPRCGSKSVTYTSTPSTYRSILTSSRSGSRTSRIKRR